MWVGAAFRRAGTPNFCPNFVRLAAMLLNYARQCHAQLHVL